MKTALCQPWLESERGWGVRDDGFSLHATEKDLHAYVKDYWDGMPAAVPDEYSRPDGKAYPVQVDDEFFAKLSTGRRFFCRPQPKQNEIVREENS